MCDGTAVWSEPADAVGPGLGDMVRIDVPELVDEVGVHFGPDAGAGGGLFDGAGERSLTGERTGVSTEDPGAEQQRMAVLTWIAASLGHPHEMAAEGPPCTAMRTCIADEPLDLLPSLSTLAAQRGGRVPRGGTGTLTPEREDSATQIDLLPLATPANAETTGTGATTTGGIARWVTPERVIRLAPWVALALLALSAAAWWGFLAPLSSD